MIAQTDDLPIRVYCEDCGREWVQRETWEDGTLLSCECGGRAMKGKGDE